MLSGEIIYKISKKIFSLIPSGNIIAFESHPDFSGNSWKVFEDLYGKYTKQYKFVWFTHYKDSVVPKGYKVKEVLIGYNSISKFLYFSERIKAKLIISENFLIGKLKDNQTCIYLQHGSPYKYVLTKHKTNVDFIISQASIFNKAICECYGVSEENVVCLGFPRNDDLSSLLELEREADKFIAWLPTFRQTKDEKRIDSKINLPLGIPIIYSKEDMAYINDVLKECNMKLIIKLHPAQSLKYIAIQSLSNIIVTQKWPGYQHINMYQWLNKSSALITDTSSVYYDYLLCKRPIGLTTDFKDAKVFDYLSSDRKGFLIDNVCNLAEFIRKVSLGDIDFDDLNKSKNKFNHFLDNNSTQRVVEFIEKYL